MICMVTDSGVRIPDAESFLNVYQTIQARTVYQNTGVVPGRFFADIAKKRGGSSDETTTDNGNYRTVSFPFGSGILKVEMPRVRTGEDGNICEGHKVFYAGGEDVRAGDVIAYLNEILKENAKRTKEEVMKQAQEIDPRWREEWVKEYEALFAET